MLRRLILLAILFIAAMFSVSIYLQPDDLSRCAAKPSGEANCAKADAVVAISGGDTSARADEAIALYQNGWANKVIFSGAAQDKSGPSNASVMKTHALESGVPASVITIDETSNDTEENAQNVAVIFKQQGIKSAILVTSGYHQRRANLEFERYASSVKIVNHPVSSDKDWSNLWWMTPYGWWLAVSELTKIGMFYIGMVL